MSLDHRDAGSLETVLGTPQDQAQQPVGRRRMWADRDAVRRVGAAVGGPVLIVGSVLFVLHDFAFGGKISNQHTDLLAYQLPLWCFMGRSLSAGHIPAWNPYALGGFPSAVDADSGWMNLPVMALFTILPCGAAMQWFIVLQPIIAGLGLYWFLRGEGISRLSSTFGGLALALAVAGARLTVFLPFADMVAWIPLLLGAASRCLRARSWPARLGWISLVAVVWGQVAAAYLGSGVVLGTAALVIYGTARTVVEVRAGRLGRAEVMWLWGVIALSLPLVNLAFLLPSLVVMPRTSISFGYGELTGLGRSPRLIVGPTAVRPDLPLKLAISPGLYLGALPLAFCFSGWWSKRYRYLVIALSALGAFSYLAMVRSVAKLLARWFRSVPLSDVYFHSPGLFAFLLFPAMAALAAVGLEAWREPRPARVRALMLLPGLLIWGGFLWRARLPFHWFDLLIEGTVAGGIVLAVSLRRPAVLLVLPLLLAGELIRSDLAGQTTSTRVPFFSMKSVLPLHAPTVSAAAYLRAGPIERALQSRDEGRFLGLAPGLLSYDGYLFHQSPTTWNLLVNQRGMLFGLEDVQGYNSIQLQRYWRFVRAVSPIRLHYNAGVFPDPLPIALDLLQVRWVVGPRDVPPLSSLTRVGGDENWALYERNEASPRASVVSAWRMVDVENAALREVLAPGFDPAGTVILERDPGLGPSGVPAQAGTAVYRALGTQAASVVVDASSPSIVLVRNIFDPGWHATVDGRPASVLAADYVVQGIPVSAGHHVIHLAYDDPSIRDGLAGSAVALAALLGAGLALRRRAGRAAEPPALLPSAEGRTSK